MKTIVTMAVALGTLAGVLRAGEDDFKRERRAGDPRSAAKDALEGKTPPPLAVEGWMNTDGALALSDLRGKVVVLKFWGVW